MRYYTIITDSSCDLPASLAEKLGIRVVPLSVFVEGKQYYNYLDGRDISNEEFYGQLVQGKMVTTSAVNVEQFKMVMESELLTGHDVLYIGFSSGLSGTYNAGRMAAEELRESTPTAPCSPWIPCAPPWARECWCTRPPSRRPAARPSRRSMPSARRPS